MNIEELFNQCSFHEFTKNTIDSCQPFTCGNTDLDEFFHYDSITYHMIMFIHLFNSYHYPCPLPLKTTKVF